MIVRVIAAEGVNGHGEAVPKAGTQILEGLEKAGSLQQVGLLFF